jgi:pimeloyl-ACP methyl ester carboxylesterase
MRNKTLLLTFIHGFKGGEDTFGATGEFTEHLASLVTAALGPGAPTVRTLVYPTYETRGDLAECVARFRDWLQEKVIDLEVAAGTPSPTVGPGVRVVLIGHSMGGIVAAETAIALADEQVISHDDDDDDDKANEAGAPSGGKDHVSSLMFPYIQGVLAFDTPYLGIAPGVVAHGAEGHYQTAAAALTQLSGLSAIFGGAKSAEDEGATANKKAVAALEAPPSEKEDSSKKAAAAAGGGWGNWGKMAMYAGAGAALVAGGTAAYMNRQQISDGWGWVGSHLQFVGCLARGEELRSRVAAMVRLNRELGVGFANLYTRLGRAAGSKQVSAIGLITSNQRTFCNLPSRQAAGEWREAINDAATDETGAHMTMFEPKQNPGYTKLSEDAKNLIVSWAQGEWYKTTETLI